MSYQISSNYNLVVKPPNSKKEKVQFLNLLDNYCHWSRVKYLKLKLDAKLG